MSLKLSLLTASAVAATLAVTSIPTFANAAPIRIAYGDIASMEGIPILAGIERAREQGVEIELTFVKSKDLAGQVVASGQADIGIGIPYAIIEKVSNDVRMFVQLSKLAYYPIVAKEFYSSWADLNGQEVAVQSRGSGTESIMTLLAEKNGIKFSQYTYVPGSEVRAGALLQGTVKASIVDSANRNMLMEREPDKFLLLPTDAVSATDEGMFATKAFLEANAEAVDIIIENILLSWREVQENPAVVTELREKYKLVPGLTADVEAQILPYFAELVEIDGIPLNGGGADAAKDHLAFFQLSGQITAPLESLQVENFWELAPLERVLAKLGTK